MKQDASYLCIAKHVAENGVNSSYYRNAEGLTRFIFLQNHKKHDSLKKAKMLFGTEVYVCIWNGKNMR